MDIEKQNGVVVTISGDADQVAALFRGMTTFQLNTLPTTSDCGISPSEENTTEVLPPDSPLNGYETK